MLGEMLSKTALLTPNNIGHHDPMNVGVVHETARAIGVRPQAAYSVRTAARILGIGKKTLYQAVHSGKVRALKVGRVLYVPATELARLLEGGELAPAGRGGGL